MTQEDRNKVINKIKKLLALATSANENEAALAAERAQAILAQHNLSMGEVNSVRDGDDKITQDGELRTHSWPWQRQLANYVAQMYFTKYFYVTYRGPTNARSGYDAHHFVGAAHNIEVAKVMFVYLKETVERLAREGAKNYPSSRASYITSFQNAAGNRLGWRILERIEAAKKGELKTETGTNLPALASLYDRTNQRLELYLNDHIPNIKAKKTKTRSAHLAGRMEGYEAANKIGLDQQVKKTNHEKLEDYR